MQTSACNLPCKDLDVCVFLLDMHAVSQFYVGNTAHLEAKAREDVCMLTAMQEIMHLHARQVQPTAEDTAKQCMITKEESFTVRFEHLLVAKFRLDVVQECVQWCTYRVQGCQYMFEHMVFSCFPVCLIMHILSIGTWRCTLNT